MAEAAPAGTRLQSQAARLESADWDRIEALQAFADARGISLLQLAIGGLAAQPAVASVIAGATRPEQVAANVAAAAWTPTVEDLSELADDRPSDPVVHDVRAGCEMASGWEAPHGAWPLEAANFGTRGYRSPTHPPA